MNDKNVVLSYDFEEMLNTSQGIIGKVWPIFGLFIGAGVGISILKSLYDVLSGKRKHNEIEETNKPISRSRSPKAIRVEKSIIIRRTREEERLYRDRQLYLERLKEYDALPNPKKIYPLVKTAHIEHRDYCLIDVTGYCTCKPKIAIVPNYSRNKP
jgi:hypothetical protein